MVIKNQKDELPKWINSQNIEDDKSFLVIQLIS